MPLDERLEQELGTCMHLLSTNKSQTIHRAIDALTFILSNRSRLYVRDETGDFHLVWFL